MRNIVFTRIDDRLIHGQVMTAWVHETKANEIVIIDNEVAQDDFHGIVLDGFVSSESQADKLIVLSQNLCGGTAEVQTNLSDICPQIVYAE